MSGAPSPSLQTLCAAHGIELTYWDGANVQRHAPVETLRAILTAMGSPVTSEADELEQLEALRTSALPSQTVVAEADGTVPETTLHTVNGQSWRIEFQDGEIREGHDSDALRSIPLPVGRHRLTSEHEVSTWILAAPRRLPLPPRRWGMTVPLYGIGPNGTLGRYSDLAHAAEGLAREGASFVGINPVHAGFPCDPKNYSPYAPSSRQRFSTAFLAVPGSSKKPSTGRNALLDYPSNLEAHYKALERCFSMKHTPQATRELLDRCTDRDLYRFAVHQALSERFGAYWVDWPEEVHDPNSHEVRAFAESHSERVALHLWMQSLVEEQLDDAQRRARAAGMEFGLYLDLAVGTHPAGAETWAERQAFASRVSLGAPPDAFSPNGQVWGLAPLAPAMLMRDGCSVLAKTIRQQLRFSKLLRIDHALGFDRSFWVPEGLPGTYVRMPRAEMLATVRIEAALAGATIIGEDLGNIPDGLRAALVESGLLGCSVAMFERHWQGDRSYRHGHEYDERSLASFSTHDLPTWRGWRAGRDIDWRERLGETDADTSRHQRQARESDVAAFDTMLSGPDADSMHAFIAASSSRLVVAQAQDVLDVDEQANLPGTVYEHPNWQRQLPLDGCSLADAPQVQRLADIMRAHGRSSS